MPKVVQSVRARIRVTFPQSAKDAAESSLRDQFENRAIPSDVAKRFFADAYQVVQIDVLDDGSRVIRA
jgi:tagatose-1,6-bisphosphate aldolase non-catalytic subunit AgaZ/GatZ